MSGKSELEMSELRARWNEVLDRLETKNRILWMVFFDARLAKLEGNRLTLDFSDSRKFGGAHEYEEKRVIARAELASVIKEVLGADLEIVEM